MTAEQNQKLERRAASGQLQLDEEGARNRKRERHEIDGQGGEREVETPAHIPTKHDGAVWRLRSSLAIHSHSTKEL